MRPRDGVGVSKKGREHMNWRLFLGLAFVTVGIIFVVIAAPNALSYLKEPIEVTSRQEVETLMPGDHVTFDIKMAYDCVISQITTKTRSGVMTSRGETARYYLIPFLKPAKEITSTDDLKGLKAGDHVTLDMKMAMGCIHTEKSTKFNHWNDDASRYYLVPFMNSDETKLESYATVKFYDKKFEAAEDACKIFDEYWQDKSIPYPKETIVRVDGIITPMDEELTEKVDEYSGSDFMDHQYIDTNKGDEVLDAMITVKVGKYQCGLADRAVSRYSSYKAGSINAPEDVLIKVDGIVCDMDDSERSYITSYINEEDQTGYYVKDLYVKMPGKYTTFIFFGVGAGIFLLGVIFVILFVKYRKRKKNAPAPETPVYTPMQFAPDRSAAAKQEVDKYAAQMQELYNDKEKYGKYLREAAGKLTSQQKAQITQLAENGDKLSAIKLCREMTGLGLKSAKDMVDEYKLYLAPGAAAYVEPQPEPQMSSARPTSDTKQEITWTLRVTDTEHKVEDVYKLKSNLYSYLSDVSMGREEFIVLSPSVPVGGVSCVQVAREKEGFYFHVEAVLTEKGANGRAKIMCKDRALTVDSQNILVTFYQEHKVDITGWSELGW